MVVTSEACRREHKLFHLLAILKFKTYYCLTIVMELYQSAPTWSNECLKELILGFLCPFNNTFQQQMLCKVKSQGSASYKVLSQHFPSGKTHASWSSDQVMNSEIPKSHSTVFNNCEFSQAYFLLYVIHIHVLRDGAIIQNIYFWHYLATVLGKHISLLSIILFSGNHGISGNPMPLGEAVASLKYLWIIFHVLQFYIHHDITCFYFDSVSCTTLECYFPQEISNLYTSVNYAWSQSC